MSCDGSTATLAEPHAARRATPSATTQVQALAERRGRVARYRVEATRLGSKDRLGAWDEVQGRPVILRALRHRAAVDAFHRRRGFDAGRGDRPALDGVVPMVDWVRRDDGIWAVSPWISGCSLEEVLADHDRAGATAVELGERLARLQRRRSRDPFAPAILLVERLARLVHGVHEAGLLHLDLKPTRVMLGTDGRPLLLDLGMSWPVGGDAHAEPGLPTFAYASRERISGEPELLGPATDVYGLGAILYELLSLRRPYAARSLASLAARITFDDPIPLLERAPHVPAALAEICDRALSSEASERQPSALHLARELRRLLVGRVG